MHAGSGVLNPMHELLYDFAGDILKALWAPLQPAICLGELTSTAVEGAAPPPTALTLALQQSGPVAARWGESEQTEGRGFRTARASRGWVAAGATPIMCENRSKHAGGLVRSSSDLSPSILPTPGTWVRRSPPSTFMAVAISTESWIWGPDGGLHSIETVAGCLSRCKSQRIVRDPGVGGVKDGSPILWDMRWACGC